ncbi:hypothetical protein CASFOL_023391 [Castilleja foliolosa]|uniref:Peptidase A1 domain-containing protein n=1 Tax=Castilleja foliolosa TaxID=1961234 RepID=A0ABD3CPA5_9LAMI
MMGSKHILIMIFTMFIIFSHLITPSFSYTYESKLNSSIALTVMMPMGTPPQMQRMVLDTGSQLSWVQCRKKNPSFIPNASSSFSNVACNDTVCATQATQIADLTIPMNCLHGLCRYSSIFYDGVTVEGNLVRENFTFSSSQITPPMVIGCSPKKDEMSGADGMLGMNRGNLSFISQLNESRFSYCVPLCASSNSNSISSISSNSNSNSNCATGMFYLGDNNHYSSSFRYINLLDTAQEGQSMADFDSLAYYVSLVNISINGEKLNIVNNKNVVNPNASREIMIDSGSRHTFLVNATYSAVREKIVNLTGIHMKETKGVSGIFDMCFKVGSNWSDIKEKIGEVEFEFENGVKVSIPTERTLDYINDEYGVCVAIGRSDNLGAATNILGYFFQQNLCVDFDIQRNRVGFGNGDGSN